MTTPELTTQATTAPVFGFLAPDHPFAGRMRGFRARLDERAAPSGARCQVSSEVKGRRTPLGFALDRFYCSMQAWDTPGGQPFESTTLYWSARTGAEWVQFPAEPYLHQLPAYLAGLRSERGGSSYDVLRYVPLRRFTFRSAGLVGKFKRPSRLQDSAARATAVVAAAAGSPVTVPAMRGVDTLHSIYFQDAVDGPALSDLVGPGNVTDLLGQAGRVHADFHALDAPGLPVAADPWAPLEDVVHSTDWVAALWPSLTGWLDATRDQLLATAPTATAAAAGTCHGDLVLSHLLVTGDGCTVIDLDLAHIGDRYRDLALFLAGLPADAPALAGCPGTADSLAEAERAYLGAYEERSGQRLDPRRLAWHRASAELHQLAVLFAKDRIRLADVPRVRALVDSFVAAAR